jgi:transglutaminase-like putative cysteine protease
MVYQIEYPATHPDLVEQLWLPLPNDDGDGTRDVEILEIYPAEYELLEIGAKNRAAYWGDVPDICRRTDCRFGVRFEVTLEKPQYAIPWNEPVIYDAESELYRLYTAPQRAIQSDDASLIELAQEIVGDERNVYKQVLLIQSWVQRNVLYPKPGEQPPTNALQCIEQGLGDCAGQSNTFVALSRAAGIPARVVSGLLPFEFGLGRLDEFGPRAAWMDSNLSMHVWCEVYLPPLGWVQVEPDIPGFGVYKERLITKRGPFALQDGLCSLMTHFHLPLAVKGEWCVQSTGSDTSLSVEVISEE